MGGFILGIFVGIALTMLVTIGAQYLGAKMANGRLP
jgi:hypothetical protein